MFAEWYPKLAPLKLTYKSQIIPLSNSFVDLYLKADGMHMPEIQPDVTQMDEQQKTEYMEDVYQVRQQITECLSNNFTAGCLLKMNWSSTIDAEFISQTLECNTADEVFLQLKASQNVSGDLCEPYDASIVCLERLTSREDFKWTLVLRKWHPNHNIGMEFRCFV